MKTTHQAIVVPVVLRKHENADALSIVSVNDTFNCVVRSEDWQGIDKGVYIQPQNMVDTNRPEFAFLKKDDEQWVRIKPARLRGVWSYGLLVPCPFDCNLGDDLSEHFNVRHWEPEERLTNEGKIINAGQFNSVSKYDIDSAFSVHKLIPETQLVVATEKLNGANCRIVSDGTTTFVGSRTGWFSEGPSPYWKAYKWLREHSDVEGFLRDKPGHILYGEAYGMVKGYHYGGSGIRFAGFDIRLPSLAYMPYYDYAELMSKYRIHTAPYIGEFYHYYNKLQIFAVGDSLVEGSNHIREGCVIRPTDEIYHESVGRLVYKIINPEY
jgi:RNA ligase (TIGR02306 family)